MTNRDYSVPLDEMPTKAGIQTYAWREFMEDHYDTIIHALRLAQRIKQGPSEGMLIAGVNHPGDQAAMEACRFTFNCMIRKLLKEVGDE